MWQTRRIFASLLLIVGCKAKTTEPLPAPASASVLGENALIDSGSAAGEETPGGSFPLIWGEPIPPAASHIQLRGERAEIGGETLRSGEIGLHPIQEALLVADEETFLAQVSPLLSTLDQRGIDTWLKHPSRPLAFRLTLKDEHAFQIWLDQPVPGKIRIIQRADGLELQTGIGKLPGSDPNGPTIPLRGGQLDVGKLRRLLVNLSDRFDHPRDACVVPSFGTELAKVATILPAFYRAPGVKTFPEVCLVYPALAKSRSRDN